MIQQTTRNNNAMYGVPRESRAYVGNEGSYYVGEGCKQQAGWRWASPTGECESPNSRQWGRQTPRFYRILDKVPRSKRINSRLNERELATLQKRRGRTA